MFNDYNWHSGVARICREERATQNYTKLFVAHKITRNGFCLTGPISLCLDSFLYYVLLYACVGL